MKIILGIMTVGLFAMAAITFGKKADTHITAIVVGAIVGIISVLLIISMKSGKKQAKPSQSDHAQNVILKIIPPEIEKLMIQYDASGATKINDLWFILDGHSIIGSYRESSIE